MADRESQPKPEKFEEHPLTLSSTPQKAMARYLEYRKHRFPEDESIEKAAREIADELEEAKGERTELLNSGERTNMMRHFNISSPVPMSHKSVLIQALIAHIKTESAKLPEKQVVPEEKEAETLHEDEGPFTSLDDLAERYDKLSKDLDTRQSTHIMAEWLQFQTLDLSAEEQKEVDRVTAAHVHDGSKPQSKEFYLSISLSNRITNQKKRQASSEQQKPKAREPKIISPEKLRLEHKYNVFINHLRDRVIADLKDDNRDIDHAEKISEWVEKQELDSIDKEIEGYLSNFHPQDGTIREKITFRLILIVGKELRSRRDSEEEKEPKGFWGKLKGLFGG